MKGLPLPSCQAHYILHDLQPDSWPVCECTMICLVHESDVGQALACRAWLLETYTCLVFFCSFMHGHDTTIRGAALDMEQPSVHARKYIVAAAYGG